MKKILLSIYALIQISSNAQTVLYSNDFEAGFANWTINGGIGENQWIFNSAFDGFPILGVADTPDQPAGNIGGINSNYLHITNNTFCTNGASCAAIFNTSSVSKDTATLLNTMNSVGYGNLTVKFLYLCGGAAGVSFGKLQTNISNGGWVDVATYSGVTTWTAENIVIPNSSNSTSVRFRFLWENGATGTDPAFSIDNIIIEGSAPNTTSIAFDYSLPNTFTTHCQADFENITKNFIATGTFNAGNVFKLQRSNAAGDFTNAIDIGDFASIASGVVLNVPAIVPNNIPLGTGYKLRIVSTNPIATSPDFATTFSVIASPVVLITSSPATATICVGQTATLTAAGASTFVWTPATALNSSTTAIVQASPTTNITYTATGTSTNGCKATATQSIVVNACASLEDDLNSPFTLYPNPSQTEIMISASTFENASISIIDANGKVIMYDIALNKTIDISTLNTGVYTIEIVSVGQVAIKKLIKL
jgi:Secretion system C-terminal sorting domain